MFGEQSVNTGYADIEQPIDGVPHHFSRDACFLSDWYIRCARRGDKNGAAA